MLLEINDNISFLILSLKPKLWFALSSLLNLRLFFVYLLLDFYFYLTFLIFFKFSKGSKESILPICHRFYMLAKLINSSSQDGP